MQLRREQIVYRRVDELIPYVNNPRHNEDAVDGVAASIREFGFKVPMIVKADGEIVTGHTRILAAKKLGIDEVPTICADDLTDAQIKAFRLADNKVAEKSGWDFEKLEIELEGLDELGVDMSEFGFEEIPDEDAQSEAEDDDYDENAQVEAKAQLGDVYKLGRHRLMCGDSSDAECVKTLMGGVLADLVFTDPPYGVAIGDKNAALNEVQKAGRCTQNIANDTMSEEELYELLKKAFTNVRENCKDDASYYVTSPQGGSLGLMMMMMMMRDAGLEVRHVLMWMKNSATFSLGRLDYDYQHEPIFYTWTKSHHNYRNGRCRTTVWDFDKPRKCDLHPTMKPVELVGNAILDGTLENDNVLDVFGGSGTTLIACEQLKRNAFLMEIDPHYVDVIIDRWEKLTGRKAEKLTA